MKIGSIRHKDQSNQLVVLFGGRAYTIESLINQPCRSILQCISNWDEWGASIESGLEQASPDSGIEIDHVSLAAPVPNPGKVICIGRNYAEHAAEMGSAAGEYPVVFSKYASSIIGPDETIRLPDISEQVDYEAELVVVIGKPGSQIAEKDAMKHVFGYCCGNDISARDWQKGRPGGQWLLGKSCDSFAPLGPWLVTSDSIADPASLEIQLRLNGQTMQKANTRQLIFSIEYLISHLSKFFRLLPGDLLFTGTPAGVGAARDPQIFLKSGDQLEVEIENIGILRNSVGR